MPSKSFSLKFYAVEISYAAASSPLGDGGKKADKNIVINTTQGFIIEASAIRKSAIRHLTSVFKFSQNDYNEHYAKTVLRYTFVFDL